MHCPFLIATFLPKPTYVSSWVILGKSGLWREQGSFFWVAQGACLCFFLVPLLSFTVVTPDSGYLPDPHPHASGCRVGRAPDFSALRDQYGLGAEGLLVLWVAKAWPLGGTTGETSEENMWTLAPSHLRQQFSFHLLSDGKTSGLAPLPELVQWRAAEGSDVRGCHRWQCHS